MDNSSKKNEGRLFWRRGDPWIWLSGCALMLIIFKMIVLFYVIGSRAVVAFWPQSVVQIQAHGKKHLGEIVQSEEALEGGKRIQLKVGNRGLYGIDFRWVNEIDIQEIHSPQDAVTVERQEFGNFYGFFTGLVHNGTEVQNSKDIETLTSILSSEKEKKETEVVAVFVTAEGTFKNIPIHEIVRFYQPNKMHILEKLSYYFVRVKELFFENPRESNTEGGLFPSIFGTVLMVFLMSISAFPFGVIAGIYLREYAKDGMIISTIRVAINNLAGIPSIVYGIFGLGFFIYGLGSSIDEIFFSQRLPEPTFGTGGILWASLTLGIMTLPVVIVATEEALSSIPKGVRDASLALGATRFQTLTKVLLPMSTPGIMTGFVLAISRATGEVAPLMITGAVKLAPDLPIDGQWPFFHFDRKFMHLGFHVYDISSQSPNIEAAMPMLYVTATLLLFIVLSLSGSAILLRNRMRKKYKVGAI